MTPEERLNELEERIKGIESRLTDLEEGRLYTADDIDEAAKQGAEEVNTISEKRITRLENDIQELRFELEKDPFTRPKYGVPNL